MILIISEAGQQDTPLGVGLRTKMAGRRWGVISSAILHILEMCVPAPNHFRTEQMTSLQNKWWRRPARLAFAVILLLAAVGFIGFKLAARTGLNREMQEIRAKGFPINPLELEAWYEAVPEAENAGLKFLEADAVRVDAPKDSDPGNIDWRTIPNTQPLDGQTLAILETHLERNAEARRLMNEAFKLPLCRYPMTLSNAPNVKFTHLIALKRLAQLARYEALFKAERVDAAGALQALKNGFAVGHSLAKEPLVISELVRIACVTIQVFGVERVVNVAHFNEEQLGELISTIREASHDCRESLHRALIGERAFANIRRKLTFEEHEQLTTMGRLVPNTSEVPEIFRQLVFYGKRAAGLHDRDHSFLMRSFGRMINAAALDFPQLFTASEAVADDIVTDLQGHPIAYERSKLELPPLLRLANKETTLTARLRCIEMALQIEQWRRKNGERSPREDELPSILKPYPRDPIDSTPLQFQTNSPGGFRITAAATTTQEKKDSPSLKSPGIGFSIEK